MPTLTLAFKGRTIKVIPLHDGLMTIGREPSSDIHIDSLAVSPQHARILFRNGECTLQNNTNEETFLNHQIVDEQILEDNDLIRIGKHTLLYACHDENMPESEYVSSFTAPEPAQPSQAAAAVAAVITYKGSLQVLNGSQLGKTIQLRAGMTDLGKADLAPVLISLRKDGYYIANLGEDDNLRVSDENIGEKSYLLKDGDLIQIDKLKLQFYLE